MAIASSILWFVCLLISCIFVKPPGQDLVLIDGELRSEFGERQSERKRQAEIRQMQKDRRANEKAMERQQRQDEKDARLAEQNTPQKKREEVDVEATPSTRQSAGDDEGMEVRLSRTLDNIEDIVDDRY